MKFTDKIRLVLLIRKVSNLVMGVTMVNWKTSVGALITLLAGFLPVVGVTISPEVQAALMSVGGFIVGLFAKDHNVTGGTTRQ